MIDRNFKHKEGERDASNVTNKSVLSESKQSSVAEKENIQPKKVPLPKLRVLSSAELGSRWCPTPGNPPPCTVSSQFSHNTTAVPNGVFNTSTTVSTTTTASILANILTQTGSAIPVVQVEPAIPVVQTVPTPLVVQTVPTPPVVQIVSAPPVVQTVPAPPVIQTVPAPPVVQTVPTPPVIPPPVATPTSTGGTMSAENAEMLACLLRIHKLIVSVRTVVSSSLTDFNQLLTWEFMKLHNTLKADYTTIIQKVTNKFNESLFLAHPLSFEELFRYAPCLKYLCSREVNNKYLSKTPSNQTTYQNFQSVHTTSAQAGAQNSASSVPAAQAQCPLNLNQTPVSISSTPPQQPYQETVILQPQNNLPQYCTPPHITSNPLFKMQQFACRMEMQRPPQQKPPPAYIPKPRLVNVYIGQGGIGEPVYLSSVATDRSNSTGL